RALATHLNLGHPSARACASTMLDALAFTNRVIECLVTVSFVRELQSQIEATRAQDAIRLDPTEHDERDDGAPVVMASIDSQIGQFIERKRAESRDSESDLARISRISMLGELTASIAHEVNQPIAAVINNANAGLRWLSSDPPELDEIRLTLTNIVMDAHRAC